MTDTTITTAQRERLREALLSPDLTIGRGIGDAMISGHGVACTIAEINLVLIGELDDGPHPCMSEVIHRWVIRIQDAMPADIRNSRAWREAAVGIAGSAADEATERARIDLLLDWMWGALADEAVIASVPASALSAWQAMLEQRTAVAADAADAAAARAAARAAAHAAHTAAHAAADAAYFATDAAAARAAYWKRRHIPGTLVKLIGCTA